jgi:DNA-binding transcriptional ArsR family regulator
METSQVKPTVYERTIELLEQEIEALEQRRGELLRVIESLRPLADGAGSSRGRSRRAAKRNERTNERTNERAKRAPTARPRSLPDVTKHAAAILAALRGNGPMSPSDLAKRVKLERPAVTYHLKPLIKSGAVIATGATNNRQYSLPPRSGAAKEAP